MAKNGVTHAIIAMLIIGMVMCFANDESYNTADESINIATKSDDDYLSDTIISCITECKKRHPYNSVKRKECLEECCKAECHEWYPNDKKKFKKCTELFYKLYVR
ncbi:uncharacterized protein DS421_19g646510 [Arachis hypogaea]|uniref:Uncharacterized protein n=1 Tax=Arachis hypogaea TaxID=3818 RepID=A0A6B9V6X5_ARAHY|nr:uncharacterized protein DS421_19g646510 [Arachis hypogaea]